MRSTTVRALALTIVVCSPLALRAEDAWPSWRGRTGLGLSDEKDLPLNWGGKENENVLWKAPLPGTDTKAKFDLNQSSPIVWKDRVFVTFVYWPEGVATTQYPEQHVVCYSAADGKQLWDTKVPPGPWLLKDLRGGYGAPTPCTDGAHVYALFGSSVLAALDFDGKIVWRKEVAPYAWDVAIGTSPILYQDVVMVLADGNVQKNSRLIAYDRKSGDIKWEQKRPTSSWNHTTPVVIEVKGKPQMVIASSSALQGLDPADGKVLWWVPFKGDVPTPAYGGGLVYTEDGRGGPGLAVDPTGEGDVSKTHIKWKTAPVPEGYSSPIIAGDYVYRINNPGVLKCYKRDTGAVVFSVRLPNGMNASASPVVTPDDRLYLATAGKSIVIPVGPKFQILATNELGDGSPASPAVANGCIYLKGAKNLYCIGKK